MTDESQTLNTTALEMVAEGKGILAADESNATMTKRLEGVGAESTPDTRRSFRELLFTTPAPRSTSAARSSTTRRSARRPPTARRSRSCWPTAA